jgi:hypothetical protein
MRCSVCNTAHEFAKKRAETTTVINPAVCHSAAYSSRLNFEYPITPIVSDNHQSEGKFLWRFARIDFDVCAPSLLAIFVSAFEYCSNGWPGCSLGPLAALVLRRPFTHARQVSDECPHFVG